MLLTISSKTTSLLTAELATRERGICVTERLQTKKNK